MKHLKKNLALLSVVFIIIGICITGLGYMLGGTFSFSFSPQNRKVVTSKDMKNATRLVEKETEAFSSVKIQSDQLDTVIQAGDCFSISYPESPNGQTSYSIKDGVLTVDSVTKNQFFFFSFDFEPIEKTITITVPEALDTISLLGEDCECRIEDQTADEVSLDTDYGDIFIHNSNIKNTVIQSKNGDISFKNCQIDILDAALDYGSCTITDSVINNHTFTLKDGDALINRLTAQTSNFSLKYGDFTMADSSIEQLSVKITDGDCKISLAEDKSQYSLLLDITDGYITVDGKEMQGTYMKEASGKNTVEITSKYGDIDIISRR
ncbi:MAG: DUF4097 domain-containing protein [Lachnospiraceae bacterium]|nr:DUF4097 domain-containing protein [Lachnospiraceae bacterium]